MTKDTPKTARWHGDYRAPALNVDEQRGMGYNLLVDMLVQLSTTDLGDYGQVK